MNPSNRDINLKRINAYLLLILLAGFGLRLYQLGYQGLWYDETVSAFLASQPLLELIAHTARDIHPPGYYLILHGWARLAGDSEFALAYLSLIFSVLLMALTYGLARYLTNQLVAMWAILLTAISPYHIWYAQEVRMYTLGAVLGVAATYCALKGLSRPATRWRYWLGYAAFSALGLYTLYYFAFLLIAINLVFLFFAVYPALKRFHLIALVAANVLILFAYLPWLPIAWRQATNPPVPSWRSATSLPAVLIESWSALSLGQSVEPGSVWPVLILTLALAGLGLFYLFNFNASPRRSWSRLLVPVLLLVYTFGPLLLINHLSHITPLYHVRYVFTYATTCYIILGAGLAWLATKTRFWLALAAMLLLTSASFYSFYRFHFDPRYQTDDYRAAISFIQQQWQPGDVIITNAGYTYTAFVYYNRLDNLERKRLVPFTLSQPDHPILYQTGTVDGNPQLGWGNPQSDFYAMSRTDTVDALDQLSNQFYRLWVLRAYDTVTDSQGVIRAWLTDKSTPIEDVFFTGPSNIRVQGFLLEKQPQLQGGPVDFEDGIQLTGWRLPQQNWQPGQRISIQLGWSATTQPGTDYKVSLKLWSENGELAAQGQDGWPAGTLYRTTDWTPGTAIYQPVQLTLPDTLPSGQYWLNVELYHPETLQPLPRLDGQDPVATLGPVLVP